MKGLCSPEPMPAWAREATQNYPSDASACDAAAPVSSTTCLSQFLWFLILPSATEPNFSRTTQISSCGREMCRWARRVSVMFSSLPIIFDVCKLQRTCVAHWMTSGHPVNVQYLCGASPSQPQYF
eukprot:GGOE01013050.1.p2 GENE.GGOE01013050.1~~GGOE01013050.1.p2  ORF type:complete len:125 (-),score=7.40 GGOE01013050.1:35-409(-)